MPPSEQEIQSIGLGTCFPISTRHRFSFELNESDNTDTIKHVDDAIFLDQRRRTERRVRAASAVTKETYQQLEDQSITMRASHTSKSRPTSAPMASRIVASNRGSTALATAIVQSKDAAKRPTSATPPSSRGQLSSKLLDEYLLRTQKEVVANTSDPLVVGLGSGLPDIDEEVLEDEGHGLDGEEAVFSPSQALHWFGGTRHGHRKSRRSEESTSSQSPPRNRSASPPHSRPTSSLAVTARPSISRPQSALPSSLPPRPSSAVLPSSYRPSSAVNPATIPPSAMALVTISASEIIQSTFPQNVMNSNHLQLESKAGKPRPVSASSNGIRSRHAAGQSVLTFKSYRILTQKGQRQSIEAQHRFSDNYGSQLQVPSAVLLAVTSTTPAAPLAATSTTSSLLSNSQRPTSARHARALEAARNSIMHLMKDAP